MKVQFNYSLDAWMITNVEGNSLEDCKNKLYKMSLEELLENGYVKDSDIKNIDTEILEEDLKVEITDIEYDINEEDLEDSGLNLEMVLDSLPKTMTVEITGVKPSDDLEDILSDEITWKTDFLVKTFKYNILKKS